MNISIKTRWPIATKFCLNHHWSEGKHAIGFGPDHIRTLVSMAKDNSHRVIMGKTGKTASPCFLSSFYWILFILAGKDDIRKNLDEFKFGQIRTQTSE